MTIAENPTIGLVSVEILRPADGTFIPGRSLLGGTDVLGDGTTDVWYDVLPDAVQSVNIQRGIERDGIDTTAQVGTLSFTVLDALDPDEVWWLKRNLDIRVTQAGAASPRLITGTITNVVAETELIDNVTHVFTTVTAQDAVGQLANITRYGAASDLAPWESFAERAARLQTSAPAGQTFDVVVEPIDEIGAYTFSDIFNADDDDSGAEIAHWTVSDGKPASTYMDDLGGGFVATNTTTEPLTFSRKLPLSNDKRLYFYRMSGLAPADKSVLDVNICGYRATIAPTAAGVSAFDVVPFVADATGLLSFTLGSNATISNAVAFTRIELGTYDTEPYAIANTVYESSLASHYDLLCASVPHGGWWVSNMGGITVDGDLSSWAALPAATFSDVVGDSGTLHYTGLTRTYDSDNIVNNLTVANHSRAMDESGAWDAADVNYGFTDATSQASYGAVSADVDTCLASSVAIADLGKALLAGNSTPTSSVSAIRWNAQEAPHKALLIDVYSRITVVYKGVSTNMRVLNITHDISPTRWMVDYTLGKI